MKRTLEPLSQIGSVFGMQRHRREAAVCRRAGAALDRLLVLTTRLAQVHVHVREARQHDLLGAVDRLALRDREVLAHADDHAVADDDVEHLIEPDRRVDDPALP